MTEDERKTFGDVLKRIGKKLASGELEEVDPFPEDVEDVPDDENG